MTMDEKGLLLIAGGVIVAFVIFVLGAGVLASLMEPEATPTPVPTAIPTLSPTPLPTAEPSPVPVVTVVPEPTPVPEPGTDEWFVLQAYANEALRHQMIAEATPGDDQKIYKFTSEPMPEYLLQYPWYYRDADGSIRTCYNDANDTGRGFMWTPTKFRAYGYAEASRTNLWEMWYSSVVPHHEVTGSIVLYDQNGNLIRGNDPIIVDTRATAKLTLTNHLQDDIIGYINYDVVLYRYNVTTEGLETMYAAKKDRVLAPLVPGQPWEYTLASDIPLLPGVWWASIKIYNYRDRVLLVDLKTDQYYVAFDHGNGIISFG
jgi:hypothetical protein